MPSIPHDAWKNIPKGKQPLPEPFVGHEPLWAKIATRLKANQSKGVTQIAPIIGGRRRYHHRPMSSWLLPNGRVLTITPDKMEAEAWLRLKGKKTVATPVIYDVFKVELSAAGNRKRSAYAIVHERLYWPASPDWVLFVDTFFRWRAMQKDALKPANTKDVAQFIKFIQEPAATDPKTVRRRSVERAVPFSTMNERRKDIAQRRRGIRKDPNLDKKIKWATSVLTFLQKNKVKHRDLDPSNLARTAKGRAVVTNIAESRSRGKPTGPLKRVRAATDPFASNSARRSMRTARAVAQLLDPEAPPLESTQLFSSEMRFVIGLCHQDRDMRTAVQEAAYREGGFTPGSLLRGLKKLSQMAKLHGGRFFRLYTIVKQRLGRKVSAAIVLSASAIAAAYRYSPRAVVAEMCGGTGSEVNPERAAQTLSRIARHLERDAAAIQDEALSGPIAQDVAAALVSLSEALERQYKKTAQKLVSLR